MEQVKLLGTWSSPFSCRIKWALKLKGIPYEYIEEDLKNKSTLLLKSNPVHKMIPVLVHGGKPICESMVIIEYIEETWPQNPLLPNDPFDKAVARFWAKYADDMGHSVWKIMFCEKDYEKGKSECLDMMRTVEEQALGEKKFFGGERIGMVDLAFGWIAYWLGVMEEVIGVKQLQADSFPRLHAWTLNFKEVPEIKENLPNREDMIPYFRRLRDMYLAKP